jgi:transcriptional regulator with XRE-family HTH domain
VRAISPEFKSVVSGQIRLARKRCGLTQRAVAVALDVDTMRVSDWERGASVPNTEQVAQLAELFGVSLDWLLRGDGHETSVDPASTPDEAA